MSFYHIDTTNSLSPGMEIESLTHLYPHLSSDVAVQRSLRHLFFEGISGFGLRNLQPARDLVFLQQQLVEFIFENVRLQVFPFYPSRFSCVYASTSIESAAKWLSRIGTDVSTSRLFEVESGIAYSADASFLDCIGHVPSSPSNDAAHLLSSPAHIVHAAYQYWQSLSPVEGTPMDHIPEKQEILLPFPVRVLREIPWP